MNGPIALLRSTAVVLALSAAPVICAGGASPVGRPAKGPPASDLDVRLAPLVDEREPPEGPESKGGAEEEEALVRLPSNRPAPSKLFHRADLQSYFAEGTLAEAKAAFDRNQPRRARALLQNSADIPGLKYLSALAALQAGNHRSAARELDALCDSYLALKDECLLQAAVAHEGLRQFKEAIQRYAAISETSRPYLQARLSMARLLRRGGDLRGAMDALSRVAFEPPSAPIHPAERASALMLYADIARQAGAYNLEHRALLVVWSSFPELPQAARSAQRLEGMPLLPKARVARAEALLAVHLNTQAIEAAKVVLKRLEVPDPVACRAQFAMGKALRKERNHSAAIRTLLPVVQRCEDPELRARALFVLGYSQSVISPPEALQTYDALVAQYPRDQLAPQSQFYAAEIAANTGAVEQARERLDQLVRHYPDSDFAPEALFKWAWLERKRGDVARALAVIARTWSLPPLVATVDQRARARYWKARWLEDSGQRAAYLAELERLVREAAMTYYGLLARARLEVGDAQRLSHLLASFDDEVRERWPLDPGPLQSSPRFLAGVELIRLGLPDAEKELGPIDVKALPDDSARLLFQVLKTSGFEREARVVVARLLRASGGGLSDTTDFGVWRLAYPSLFEDAIEASSAQAKVDADLLRALIRVESSFNPRARSSTGALGLTQLMPHTANEVARTLRWGRPKRATLYDPSRNTRLGAEYIAGLIRQFEGNIVFAIAAYNAGPPAIERWRRDRPQSELDVWVEEIPIEETRGYVKRVLGSYAVYGLLRGARRPDLARAQLQAMLSPP